MKAQILTGSKREISEAVAKISGNVREAIVFVEDDSASMMEGPATDSFAEMEPFTVRVGGRITLVSRCTLGWRTNDSSGHESAWQDNRLR